MQIEAREALRWALALLSLGAGTIHLAMTIPHLAEGLGYGLSFALVGWLQLAWAPAMVVRPSRPLVLAGLANAWVAAAWLVSRTTGLPVGPNAGVAEGVALVDSLATGFNVLIVAGCAWSLLRVPARPLRTTFARPALSVLGLAVAGLTTLSFTPSYASRHSHGGGGSGDHGGSAVTVDASLADGVATADHGHQTEAPTASASTATASNVDAEGHIASEGGGHAAGSSGHGHGGPAEHTFIADEAVRDQVADELARARDAAMRFPTAADAEAAGYTQVTKYIPLIGSHWMKFSAVANPFDPDEPDMLLYDGDGLDAEVVGLSYYVLNGPTPPEGFAGPNDPWHQHIGLCVRGTLVVGGSDTTPEECAAVGGVKSDGRDAWMTHAWVVPGWESPWGTFSAENPDLR